MTTVSQRKMLLNVWKYKGRKVKIIGSKACVSEIGVDSEIDSPLWTYDIQRWKQQDFPNPFVILRSSIRECMRLCHQYGWTALT